MQSALPAGTIGLLVLGMTSGCGSSRVDLSVQPDAAPTDQNIQGIDANDVGLAQPVDGAIDVGADAVSGSATICTVTARPIPIHPDAGDAAMPTKHQFSLLIDWRHDTVTTGAGGTAKQVALVEKNGAWTTQGELSLSLSLAGSDAWERPLFKYTQMTLRPTATGCAGSATGEYLWNAMDVLYTIPFTAQLDGEKDITPPAFTVFSETRSPLHPLDLIGVGLSELIPVGTTARWVGSAGGELPMTELPPSSTLGISGFVVKDGALAFGSTYQLQVLPAAADSAGNVAASSPSITTLAGPGFLAQDGFESAVDALFGGKVSVVDSTTLPAPGGSKAVRFAPFGYSENQEASCADRFTARLAVAAGAKAVKLSAMSYEPKGTLTSYDWTMRIRAAVPNGAVSSLPSITAGTPLPPPWSGTLPGSTKYTYGTLKELAIPIPEGATDEVIFDIRRPCSEPMLPVSGWIFDDLRVE